MPDDDVKIYVPQATSKAEAPENESEEVKLYIGSKTVNSKQQGSSEANTVRPAYHGAMPVSFSAHKTGTP